MHPLVDDGPRKHVLASFELPVEQSRTAFGLCVTLVGSKAVSEGIACWSEPSASQKLDSDIAESLIHGLEISLIVRPDHILWESLAHARRKHLDALLWSRIRWVHGTLCVQVRE